MKRAFACVLLAVLPACADEMDDESEDVSVEAAVAGPLSETPDPLRFPDAIVGDGACGSSGSKSCTYALATLKNAGTTSQKITAASASGPFWVTWGGTCNNTTNAKTIQPGASCTLQFGFHPTTANSSSTGTGSVTFASGLVLKFGLRGKAVSGITATPNPLTFANATAGAACPGAGCTYGLITINNNFNSAQTISGASAPSPFWVTWGGTCNSVALAKTIPAHSSCTLQFGFGPSSPATPYSGTGTVSFSSGQSLNVGLKGVSN